MKTALIVFVRNPEPGKVKTRIAATLGNDVALSVYTKLLRHTCKVASTAPAHLHVFYSERVPPDDEWVGGATARFQQHGSDLGQRMKNAFETVFNAGYLRVAIIGSDCVDLTEALLALALEKLYHYNFVLGPSEDGGYYLMGMNVFYPDVFEEKQWSTSTVCMDTLRDIEKTNYTLYTLPLLSDVDTAEDCHRYPELLQ